MVYIVFGVSGSGKTTIGKLLSHKLKLPFYDADDFHSASNKNKLNKGFPLNDIDRLPWLEALKSHIAQWNRAEGAVLACSALKQSYRDLLSENNEVEWIWLHASFDVIMSRLQNRNNHFFNPKLLSSQFETLEPPTNGRHIEVDKTKDEILAEISKRIHKSSFGVLGLGVMGKSLALNMARNVNQISVYNREVKDVEEDVATNFVKDNSEFNIRGFSDLSEFINSLEKPRKILVMVNAGKPVDIVLENLIPLLDAGDVIVDGGNSHYKKTKERFDFLKIHDIHFVGMGVSGGEEGALKGPSMMPSGDVEGYRKVAHIFEAMAAKDKAGNSCCTYIGPEGSGHFIKMIHNGIEYAEMQLIAEVYYFLRFYKGFDQERIADVFENWQASGIGSYLLEISIDILRKKENGDYLLDKILDKASQKGTGGWSTNAALNLGKPLNTIADAVFARYISAMKTSREHLSKKFSELKRVNKTIDLDQLKNAYQFSRIVNHTVGFDVINEASVAFNWNLNLSEIARIWTNGCIIRSDLMETIIQWLKSSNYLFMVDDCADILKNTFSDAQNNLTNAILSGCSMIVHSSALNYFLMMVNAQSSANMIQAQRDYFGAHTYQRVDKPNTDFFHTKW